MSQRNYNGGDTLRGVTGWAFRVLVEPGDAEEPAEAPRWLVGGRNVDDASPLRPAKPFCAAMHGIVASKPCSRRWHPRDDCPNQHRNMIVWAADACD